MGVKKELLEAIRNNTYTDRVLNLSERVFLTPKEEQYNDLVFYYKHLDGAEEAYPNIIYLENDLEDLVEALNKNTHIKELILSSQEIKDEGLVKLKGLTSIEYLNLDCNELSQSIHFQDIPNLKRISLNNFSRGTLNLDHLLKFTHITARSSSIGLPKGFFEKSSVEKMDIGYSSLDTFDEFKNITKCKNLTFLGLEFTEDKECKFIDFEKIDIILSKENLEVVYLRGAEFNEKNIDAIIHSNLKKLYVGNSNLENNDILNILKNSERLEGLYVGWVSFQDMRNLIEKELTNVEISESGEEDYILLKKNRAAINYYLEYKKTNAPDDEEGRNPKRMKIT